MIDALGYNSSIVEFALMDSVPDSNEFLQQLHITRNAACSWVEMMSNVSFDIFKGFDTEQDLVDYFLTKAYWENVTIFASKVYTFC